MPSGRAREREQTAVTLEGVHAQSRSCRRAREREETAPRCPDLAGSRERVLRGHRAARQLGGGWMVSQMASSLRIPVRAYRVDGVTDGKLFARYPCAHTGWMDNRWQTLCEVREYKCGKVWIPRVSVHFVCALCLCTLSVHVVCTHCLCTSSVHVVCARCLCTLVDTG